MSSIMIDVEALALRPGAAITQIGAVVFDIHTGAMGQEFQCYVKPSPPFVADVETIQWHLEHGNAIVHPDAVEPAEAVALLIQWLDIVAPLRETREMWSWGIDYDFGLLAPYIDLRGPGIAEPWRYHQTRCARTIWKIAHDSARSPERPHTALADAKATVINLVEALKILRGEALYTEI